MKIQFPFFLLIQSLELNGKKPQRIFLKSLFFKNLITFSSAIKALHGSGPKCIDIIGEMLARKLKVKRMRTFLFPSIPSSLSLLRSPPEFS